MLDVIVIGGGAAGLFCAMTAGERGRRVLVLEHAEKLGKKILISGGGRCNFTNRDVSPANFISRNPHFTKSALSRYTPQDFVKLIEKHNIEYYEKKLGQLFCRDSARQIVGMLEDECERAGVTIKFNCAVKAVRKNDVFEVETSQGVFTGKALVIATGGLSFPKIGATDFGYRIANQFGLKIVETRPALVPLAASNGKTEMFRNLAGVSINTNVGFGKQEFRENILFTHRGLSGPAILQISSYWKPNEAITVDLLPNADARELLQCARTSKQELVNFLGAHLPHRFAAEFCANTFRSKPLARLSNRDIESIADNLHNWQIRFDATEGYHKAEVTLGGADTNELSSKTMEAKRVPGLYFVGEVMDVTGWLGGYNFQWAWASGYAAGQFV